MRTETLMRAPETGRRHVSKMNGGSRLNVDVPVHLGLGKTYRRGIPGWTPRTGRY